MALFVLRSTFDVRRSFFLYMSGINSMFVRRSTFDAQYFLYIYQGISNVRPSFVVRRSTFNFFYACMIERWNVRRSTFVKLFWYMIGVLNVRRTSKVEHSIVLSYMHTKNWTTNVEWRTKDEHLIYLIYIKKILSVERRTNIEFIPDIYKKNERRTSNVERRTNI